MFKNESFWNFAPNAGRSKFRHGIVLLLCSVNAPCFGHKDGESHAQDVESCYQLSSRKVDARSVINWATVVKLIMPPSSDARLLLLVPRTHKKLGDRSFSAAGPRLWNDLPPGLRLSIYLLHRSSSSVYSTILSHGSISDS